MIAGTTVVLRNSRASAQISLKMSRGNVVFFSRLRHLPSYQANKCRHFGGISTMTLIGVQSRDESIRIHQYGHLPLMENVMRSALAIALAISMSAATTAWAQNAQAPAPRIASSGGRASARPCQMRQSECPRSYARRGD